MGFTETVPSSGTFDSAGSFAYWFNNAGGEVRRYQNSVYKLTGVSYSSYPSSGQLVLTWSKENPHDEIVSTVNFSTEHENTWQGVFSELFYSGPGFWASIITADVYGNVVAVMHAVIVILGYPIRQGYLQWGWATGPGIVFGHVFGIHGNYITDALTPYGMPPQTRDFSFTGAIREDWYDGYVELDRLPPFLLSLPSSPFARPPFYESTFRDSRGKEFTQRFFAPDDTTAMELVNGWATKSQARWERLKKIRTVPVSSIETQQLPATANFARAAAESSCVRVKARFVYLTAVKRNDIRFELPGASSSLVTAADPKSTTDPLSPTTRAKLTTSTGIPARVLKAIRYDERVRRR